MTNLVNAHHANTDPVTGRWYAPRDYLVDPDTFRVEGEVALCTPAGGSEARRRAASAQHHLVAQLDVLMTPEEISDLLAQAALEELEARDIPDAGSSRPEPTGVVDAVVEGGADTAWDDLATGRAWLTSEQMSVLVVPFMEQFSLLPDGPDSPELR